MSSPSRHPYLSGLIADLPPDCPDADIPPHGECVVGWLVALALFTLIGCAFALAL